MSYQTNRIDNGTAVITIPAAYRRWNSKIDYKWIPFKNNKSQLSTQFINKNYSPIENQQLRYWAIGSSFKTIQKFKRKGKKSSYLSGIFHFQQRDYINSPTQFFLDNEDFEDIDFSEDFDLAFDELSTFRRWTYFTQTIEYSFYLQKNLKLTIGLAHQSRKDVWDEQFGYRQLRHFYQLKWKREQWQVSWKTGVVLRQFSDLFADENEAYLLRHLYLRNSFNLTYQLNKSWSISANFNLRQRWRNQPPNSTNSYPSYLTGIVWVGIKYEWGK